MVLSPNQLEKGGWENRDSQLYLSIRLKCHLPFVNWAQSLAWELGNKPKFMERRVKQWPPIKISVGKSSMNSWLNIPIANIQPIPCPFLSRKLHCLRRIWVRKLAPTLENMAFLLWVIEIGESPTHKQGTTLAFHRVLRHKVSQQGPNRFEISKTRQLILFV